MKLSVIVPVFNEEKTAPLILNKLLTMVLPGVNLEIVVVNDASSDKTRDVLKKIKGKKTKIIEHKKNLGKGAAIRTGMKYATGEYILIQDADAEYNPRYISDLIAPIQKELGEVVYGTRLRRLPNFYKEERTVRFFIHYLGNRVLSLLASILYGQWLTDVETGYKVIPRKTLKEMKLKSNRFEFEIEVTAKLLRKGHRIVEIPIATIPREYKEGKKLHTIPDGCKAIWSLFRYRFGSI